MLWPGFSRTNLLWSFRPRLVSFDDIMRSKTAQCGALILMTVLTVFASSQQQVISKLSADNWKEDLRFLAKELPRNHKNLYHTLTQADFNSAVSDLDARIPT